MAILKFTAKHQCMICGTCYGSYHLFLASTLAAVILNASDITGTIWNKQVTNKKTPTMLQKSQIICGNGTAKLRQWLCKKNWHTLTDFSILTRGAWQSDILAKLTMEIFYTITIQPKQAFSVFWEMLVLQWCRFKSTWIPCDLPQNIILSISLL